MPRKNTHRARVFTINGRREVASADFAERPVPDTVEDAVTVESWGHYEVELYSLDRDGKEFSLGSYRTFLG
jgi:hypothetical protein